MKNNIRNFKENDLISLQELIYQTIDACYTDVYPPLAINFFKTFHSKENIIGRNLNGEIVVIENDGKIIATGSVVANDIFAVFVNPSFQHHGLGRNIMLELEKRAKLKGVTEIELSVSLPSKKFYKSLNYNFKDECSIDVGEGQLLRYWSAVKQLR